MRPTGWWVSISTKYTTNLKPISKGNKRFSKDWRRASSTVVKMDRYGPTLPVKGWTKNCCFVQTVLRSIWPRTSVRPSYVSTITPSTRWSMWSVTNRTTISRYSPSCWINSVLSLAKDWFTSPTAWSNCRRAKWRAAREQSSMLTTWWKRWSTQPVKFPKNWVKPVKWRTRRQNRLPVSSDWVRWNISFWR